MKCRYCKREIPEDYRYSHTKICKNVSPEVRYIHSGIPQTTITAIIDQIEALYDLLIKYSTVDKPDKP